MFISRIAFFLTVAKCGVLGIKQRMRMTVANGPGFIPNLSTVHLSSSSGLEFSSLHQSSVIVRSRNQTTYETERAITIVVDSSKSNDAVIYLPECRPFEDIELYFDVTTLKPSQDLEDGYTQKHKVREVIYYDILSLRLIGLGF